MAEEKVAKKTALSTFRKSMVAKGDMSSKLTEGLKSTNAKVRAQAAKNALRSQDNAFIKKSVLPLIAVDKSKKVLRVISKRITRKSLIEKIAAMTAVAGKKVAAPADAAPKA